tara:strand:+ start:470 stop:691 length:222 start_codon:yes stop_codon:yes gene_type:complete
MRYINKNQIVEFLVEETKPSRPMAMLSPDEECYIKMAYQITIEFVAGTSVFLENKTKEECVALAEKLGLTLID